MKSRLTQGIIVVLALVATGPVCGQDCGCGSPAEGGHRHFWPGPYGGANCGREYNQSQAEALWAGYCSENCGLCGRGCGGTCGLKGIAAGGPASGCSHGQVRQAHFAANRWGHQHGQSGGPFSRPGNGVACGTPGEMGGKACGRSLFGCSQWGWGNCGQGCGCSNCGVGASRAAGEHFQHIGRPGRYFQPTACDVGCDERAGEVVPPHASSAPASFHRYHSGGVAAENPAFGTITELPVETTSGPLPGRFGN